MFCIGKIHYKTASIGENAKLRRTLDENMQTREAPEFSRKKERKPVLQWTHSCSVSPKLRSAGQHAQTTCATLLSMDSKRKTKNKREGHLLIFLLGATAYQRPQRASGLICTFKLRVTATTVLPVRPGETPQTLRTALKT